MPSRKRAQGKARKKAQAEAKSKESAAAAATKTKRQAQEELVHSIMQRSYKLGCPHGRVPWDVDVCVKFAVEFTNHRYPSDAAEALAVVSQKEEYAEMLKDASKMKWLVSYFSSLATQNVITNGPKALYPRFLAHFACYFEEYIATVLNKTKASINRVKIIELYMSDDHTLIRYLKHRIPCSCLDDTYKQVKATKKMGICFNKDCRHLLGMVERSKTMSCSRCRAVTYCCQECQEVDWPRHQGICELRTILNYDPEFNLERDSILGVYMM